MHVVQCFYFLMLVYMDHASEIKLMYVCMYVWWLEVWIERHFNICDVGRSDMRQLITAKIRSWSKTCRRLWHVLRKRRCCWLRRLTCCELIRTQQLRARNLLKALEVSHVNDINILHSPVLTFWFNVEYYSRTAALYNIYPKWQLIGMSYIMIPQLIMQPSIACANGQLDPWCS